MPIHDFPSSHVAIVSRRNEKNQPNNDPEQFWRESVLWLGHSYNLFSLPTDFPFRVFHVVQRRREDELRNFITNASIFETTTTQCPAVDVINLTRTAVFVLVSHFILSLLLFCLYLTLSHRFLPCPRLCLFSCGIITPRVVSHSGPAYTYGRSWLVV